MVQDIRHACRSLARSPGFTAVAIFTLALGIGGTTAIFSLFDAVLLKSLPVRDPEELVIVPAGQYPMYQTMRRQTDVFTDVLAAASIERMAIAVEGGEAERLPVSLASSSYFSTLGVSAAVGRVFDAGDEQAPGVPAIAVVSHGFWQQRLAGDARVVGRVIRVGGTPLTIVGVAPAGFFGEEVGVAPAVWVPLTMWGQVVPGRNLLESPATAWLRTIGRLKPGVSVSQAEARLTPVMRLQLEEIFGARMSPDDKREIAAFTPKLALAARGTSSLRGQFGRPLHLLMAAVLLVLLISCANVANLSLARAASRRREVDVRLALGVSRVRLVGQLFAESLVLAFAGGALGLVMAWAGREALLRLISVDGVRVPVPAQTDLRLLVFVGLVSMATAIIFGSVPAWRSLRGSLVTSLASRQAIADRRSQLAGPAMVVAQVAVSLVLLTGAGLFLRTLTNLRQVDLGFVPERLVVLDVNPRAAGYSLEQAAGVTHRILERLQAVPGISAASFSENGVMFGRDSSTNLLRPQGFTAGPDGFPRAQWDVVGPRYFSTMGIALGAGRDFSEEDNESSPNVVAINEAMARRFFAGVNPIGRRLLWGDVNPTDLEVVAVVQDVKQSGPRDTPRLRFYLPHRQLSKTRPSWDLASVQFVVRTSADSAAMRRVLELAVTAEDPRLSVDAVRFGPELLERALVHERMIAALSAAFGLVGVGLACIGLYGLIAYHVVQRTNEIGIRMALGAERSQVLLSILRRALLWTGSGLAIGIPLALGTSRVLAGLLFGLSATDAATLGGAVIALLAFGLAAAYVPARRAARIDPLAALKYE